MKKSMKKIASETGKSSNLFLILVWALFYFTRCECTYLRGGVQRNRHNYQILEPWWRERNRSWEARWTMTSTYSPKSEAPGSVGPTSIHGGPGRLGGQTRRPLLPRPPTWAERMRHSMEGWIESRLCLLLRRKNEACWDSREVAE